MNPWQRLFDPRDAFDHLVTRYCTAAIVLALVLAPLIIGTFRCCGKLDESAFIELKRRCASWVVLAVLIVAPILLGAGWFILFVCLLSLMCYREFARATGLFRQHLISVLVILGILAITFAVLDHWYGFFVALTPLTIAVIAAAAVLPDRPNGYLQRVALGAFAFLFMGVCFGHLGYLANDTNYRPILIWLLICIELNDVFAFLGGKLTGRRRLAPNTSPNKTVGGAVSAVVLTTALSAGIGHYVFEGSVLGHPVHLIVMGALISVAGQLGDLVLSSVKRDLDIKDMSRLIPGHGGLLDRFDSLLLVAPAIFHYIGYFQGVGLDLPPRIISGQ